MLLKLAFTLLRSLFRVSNLFPNVHLHIVVAYEQLKMLICENISVQKHEEIAGTGQDLVNRF